MEKGYSEGSKCPPLKDGLPRLYSMRFCSYAHRARLVLAYYDILHETININLDDKPEWFQEKNPLGQVPVLEYDDKIICESETVCAFLDEDNGRRLTPQDPDRQKDDQRLLQNYSKVTSPFYDAMFSVGKDKSSVAAYHAALSVYEAELKDRGGTFFGGDSVMMIDFLLYPHMEKNILAHKIVPEMELSKDKYPILYSWVRRMQELPAIQKTQESDDLHLEFMNSYYVLKNRNCDTGL